MLKPMKIILYGDPRTKKNSARILKARANRRIVAPSEAFMQYQEKSACGRSNGLTTPSHPA